MAGDQRAHEPHHHAPVPEARAASGTGQRVRRAREAQRRATRLWLTCRPNGTDVLTKLRPLIRTPKGPDEAGALQGSAPATPIGVRDFCEQGIMAVLGTTLAELEPRRVPFRLEPIGEPADARSVDRGAV